MRQHGHVGGLVAPDHLGGELPLVGELDPHLAGTVHHVGIGEDHAVRPHDEARALATDDALALRMHRDAEAAEELPERVVRSDLPEP